MKIKSLVEKSTLALIFFPFVGIIPGIDVQPFALLALLFFCFFFVKSYTYQSVIVLVVCIASMFMVSLFHIDSFTKAHAVYIASIATIFFIYSAIKSGNFVISNRFVKNVILVYLSIGVIQIFIPDFLEFLTSRQNSKLLSESGRGVKSLTPEPSVFGTLLIFLNLLYLYTYIEERGRVVTGTQLLILSIVSFNLLAFSVLLIQSFFAFFLHLLTLSILFFFIRKRYFILLFLVCIFLFALVSTMSLGSGRFFVILDIVMNNPDFLLKQGAMARLLNIPISIIASLQNGILGVGFDASNTVDISLFNDAYKMAVVDRNLGGFIEFFLKLGFASIPLFLILFLVFYKLAGYKVFINNRSVNLGLGIVFSLAIIIINNGTMVSPIIWFTLFYIIYSKSELSTIRCH